VADDLKIVRSIGASEIRSLLEQYPLDVNTTVGVGPLEKLQNS
jgi:hypothetical protein